MKTFHFGGVPGIVIHSLTNHIDLICPGQSSIGYSLMGEVEISGKPMNPKGAEQDSEVAVLSLEEACRRLETKEDDGKAVG